MFPHLRINNMFAGLCFRVSAVLIKCSGSKSVKQRETGTYNPNPSKLLSGLTESEHNSEKKNINIQL